MGQQNPSPKKKLVNEWESYLSENDDRVLLTIDHENEIHHFEWDDGQLYFMEHNSIGYDYNGSQAALESAIEGGVKPVPETAIKCEIKKLVSGEYDTIQKWLNDEHEAVETDIPQSY